MNRENRAFDDTYWRERNDPAWEDISIMRYAADLKQEIANLCKDKVIANLHKASVKAHIAKRDELLKQPEYQAMQTQLRAASKLPPQEEAMLLDLGLIELDAAQ